MGKGSGRYSNKIWVDAIYLKKNNQTTPAKIVDSRVTTKRRPTKWARAFCDIGFEQGWLDSRFIKTLMVHGFDKGYWDMRDLIRKYDEKEDEENGEIPIARKPDTAKRQP